MKKKKAGFIEPTLTTAKKSNDGMYGCVFSSSSFPFSRRILDWVFMTKQKLDLVDETFEKRKGKLRKTSKKP